MTSFPAPAMVGMWRDGREPVRDLWARLLLSPVFGALVPNLSGLIDNTAHPPLQLFASYAYFTVTAFLIWEGNRRLYFRFPQRAEWFSHPWRRLTLLLGLIGVFTIPVTTGLLLAWMIWSADPGATWRALTLAVLSCVAVVAIVTHVYETVFVLFDWQREAVGRERAELARVRAELDALKFQVEPHFLFNSLNALAHLVETRDARASDFIEALTETYRYVLDSRARTLVTLAEELSAFNAFADLVRIRFAESVRMHIEVPANLATTRLLPPVTLQELLENAVKHNVATSLAPLTVTLRASGETLVVSNSIQPALVTPQSTGVGLANLAGRYRLCTDRPVVWGPEGTEFRVWLPLLRTDKD